MPHDTERLFSGFSTRLRALDATRRRVDKLVATGAMSQKAGDQMYESLFLNAFTTFESLIEESFISLLLAAPANRRHDVIPRVDVRSRLVARGLALGGRKYVDWMPFDLTIARAKLFFRGGRPFSTVPDPQQLLVNKAQIIRNVIAHRSRHSNKRFLSEVIGFVALAPREQTPAGYLRGLATAAPAVSRYETFASSLLVVAKHLCR